MRDVHTILKNWADSPFHQLFTELQECMQKLINAVKSYKNSPNDALILKSLRDAAASTFTCVSKMWLKYEELTEQQEVANINEAIQVAANTTSQILRSVYSGAYDAVDSLCDLFLEKCTQVSYL
jgi:hypothetical protein